MTLPACSKRCCATATRSRSHQRQCAIASISRQMTANFLAAVARQHVFGPDRRGHDPRDARQHLVTGQVTVLVVDLLEVVDVDEQQRQRLLVADGEADLDCSRSTK
jgi:hypothetical protein